MLGAPLEVLVVGGRAQPLILILGGLAFEPGLLLIAAGMIVGVRVSTWMLVGSCLTYFVLIPWARLDPEATLRVGPTVAHPIQRVADLAAELGARGVRTGPIWGPAW